MPVVPSPEFSIPISTPVWHPPPQRNASDRLISWYERSSTSQPGPGRVAPTISPFSARHSPPSGCHPARLLPSNAGLPAVALRAGSARRTASAAAPPATTTARRLERIDEKNDDIIRLLAERLATGGTVPTILPLKRSLATRAVRSNEDAGRGGPGSIVHWPT